MGWFDEQIKERQQADYEEYKESFKAIADAVTGKSILESLEDDLELTTDAIEQILRYYNVKPQELPEGLDDINEILEFHMRPQGIMRRTVKLEKGWRKDAVGAMLGTRKDDGSVVALLPSKFSGYRFYDKEQEKYVRINRHNESLFEEEAIAFYKPFPLKKMTFRDFTKYLTQQVDVMDVAMLIGAMIAVTSVNMITTSLTKTLFSDVYESNSVNLLIGMAIYMICVAISTLLFSIAQNFVTARISMKLDITVEAASIMRILSLPPSFFKKYNAGELSSRVGYLNDLSDKMISMFMSTGLTSLFSLVYIYQVFIYAPGLVGPALIFTLFTTLISIARVIIHSGVSKNYMQLTAQEGGLTHELVGGIQKIRLAGAEHRAFAKWGKLYAESARIIYNPPILMSLSSVLSMGVSLIGTAVLYFMAIETDVAVADYCAFNSAYGLVNGAFLALAEMAVSAARIKPTMQMVKPILESVPEIDQKKKIVTSLNGGIEISNVTFRYRADMPQILNNISLKIKAGQYVAIVGKTGCGKSTLLRILLGFEKPQKGAVYYDGNDLNTLDPKSLRRKIGSVMQDGKLFMGDIYSNITISAPWLTMDEAWEAAEIAGLADDIRRMPMGMRTVISEGNGSISGGQRQRLMIARAIASKPKILMFDEATSALDNLTQKKISTALDEMNCTRIVIAHRLSTIRQCDRIIVLDEGKIIEDGSYDKLIKKNGFFAELVARQRLDDTEYVGHTTTF